MQTRLVLAFLLLVAPITPAQFADSPEKRVPDPVGRFRYIREYNRAIRNLAGREKCDDACHKDIGRFSAGIAFMTEFSDDKVKERAAPGTIS